MIPFENDIPVLDSTKIQAPDEVMHIFKRFILSDGLLYYRENTELWRLAIPCAMVRDLLAAYHDD